MAEKNSSSSKSTTSIKFNGKFLLILVLIVFGAGFMSAFSDANDNNTFLNDNYIVVSSGYIDIDNRYPSVSYLNVNDNSYLYYQPIKVSGIDTSDIYDTTSYFEIHLINNNSAILHIYKVYDFYKTNVLEIPDTINEPFRIYFNLFGKTINIELLLNMGIVNNKNQRLIFNDNESNQLRVDFTNVSDMNNFGSLILNDNNVKSIFGVVDFVGNIRDGLDDIFKFVNTARETSFKFISDGFSNDLARWYKSFDFRFNFWVDWFN